MENFTRVSDSIRKDTSLNASEKLFIGFLETYQSTPDNYSTKNYCFLKQEELAKELGESLSTIKRIIASLISKGIIFQSQARNYNKTGYQFKNRKATILVDENNPLPTPIDIKKKAPKEAYVKTEAVTPEVIKEVVTTKQLTIEDELENIELSLTIEPINNNENEIVDGKTKEEWKEEFISFNGRFAKEGSPLTPADFRKLTKDRYCELAQKGSTYGITQRDFECFWNVIIKLENELILV